MFKYLLSEIIEYVTDEIGLDESNIRERANRNLKQIIETYFLTTPYSNRKEQEEILSLLRELRQIRKVYRKGKPFVRNQVKGKSKGIISNYIDSVLKRLVEKGEIEKAKQEAKDHLEGLKKIRSERTYYRHQKRIRELGIDI
jgi:hypothetical protein